MPRLKKEPTQPIQTFSFKYRGKPYIVEVWANYPGEGKPGTHRRALRARIFDLALTAISDQYYFSANPARKTITKRSLYEKRFNSELLEKIQSVCKANRITAVRSTVYIVAGDIKTALKAMDNAIAVQANRAPRSDSLTRPN